MAISDRQRRQVINNIDTKQSNVMEWMTKRTLEVEGKPVSGDKLYNKLFGKDPLVEFVRSLSSQAVSVEELFKTHMKDSSTGFIYPTIKQFPDCSRENAFRFTLRSMGRDQDTSIRVPAVYLILPITKPTFRIRYLICSWGSRPWVSIEWTERTSESVPEDLTHSHFVPLIRQLYGDTLLSQIDLLVNYHDLMSPLSNLLGVYVQKCKSLGGLYQKLPVLNTLCPNHSLDHVSYTRATPPPPDQLRQLLDTLSTTWAAYATTNRS